MIVQYILEESLVSRSKQSTGIFHGNSLCFFPFHGQAQHIVNFESICWFITALALGVQVTAQPARGPVFPAIAGCMPDIHAAEMGTVWVRISNAVQYGQAAIIV